MQTCKFISKINILQHRTSLKFRCFYFSFKDTFQWRWNWQRLKIFVSKMFLIAEGEPCHLGRRSVVPRGFPSPYDERKYVETFFSLCRDSSKVAAATEHHSPPALPGEDKVVNQGGRSFLRHRFQSLCMLTTQHNTTRTIIIQNPSETRLWPFTAIILPPPGTSS